MSRMRLLANQSSIIRLSLQNCPGCGTPGTVDSESEIMMCQLPKTKWPQGRVSFIAYNWKL